MAIAFVAVTTRSKGSSVEIIEVHCIDAVPVEKVSLKNGRVFLVDISSQASPAPYGRSSPSIPATIPWCEVDARRRAIVLC